MMLERLIVHSNICLFTMTKHLWHRETLSALQFMPTLGILIHIAAKSIFIYARNNTVDISNVMQVELYMNIILFFIIFR